MTKETSESVQNAWARLVRAHTAAMSIVETALKDAQMPQLSWYDALLELERAGGDGMRPFELERALLLPQYGLSRLIERLEKAGYVERRPCADDARGQVVAITRQGRAIRQRAWPVYAAAIQRAVGDRLDPGEVETLASLLGRIARPHPE